MITRGVASVRSPVKNLQEFSPAVTHENFVRAMVQAFRQEYHIEEPVRLCRKVVSSCSSLPLLLAQVQYVQAEDAINVPYIRDGMAEMPVGVLTFPWWT